LNLHWRKVIVEALGFVKVVFESDTDFGEWSLKLYSISADLFNLGDNFGAAVIKGINERLLEILEFFGELLAAVLLDLIKIVKTSGESVWFKAFRSFWLWSVGGLALGDPAVPGTKSFGAEFDNLRTTVTAKFDDIGKFDTVGGDRLLVEVVGIDLVFILLNCINGVLGFLGICGFEFVNLVLNFKGTVNTINHGADLGFSSKEVEEFGYLGNDRFFIWLDIDNIFWIKEDSDAEFAAGIECFVASSEMISLVKRVVVKKCWAEVVDEGAEGKARGPGGGEVVDGNTFVALGVLLAP